jgi:hypothetical protein
MSRTAVSSRSAWTVAALCVATAIAAPVGEPLARADDALHAGAPCPSDALGSVEVADDGSTIRCLVTEQGALTWTVDSGAASTIGELQGQGYTVTVDRMGTGPLPQCKVTGVRNPVTITRVTTNPTGPHVPAPLTTITLSRTISVSLDCTGG